VTKLRILHSLTKCGLARCVFALIGKIWVLALLAKCVFCSYWRNVFFALILVLLAKCVSDFSINIFNLFLSAENGWLWFKICLYSRI